MLCNGDAVASYDGSDMDHPAASCTVLVQTFPNYALDQAYYIVSPSGPATQVRSIARTPRGRVFFLHTNPPQLHFASLSLGACSGGLQGRRHLPGRRWLQRIKPCHQLFRPAHLPQSNSVRRLLGPAQGHRYRLSSFLRYVAGLRHAVSRRMARSRCTACGG